MAPPGTPEQTPHLPLRVTLSRSLRRLVSCLQLLQVHTLAGQQMDPSPGPQHLPRPRCFWLLSLSGVTWTLMGGGWPSPHWPKGSCVAGGHCSLRGWDPIPVLVMEVLGKGGPGGRAQASLLGVDNLFVTLHLSTMNWTALDKGHMCHSDHSPGTTTGPPTGPVVASAVSFSCPSRWEGGHLCLGEGAFPFFQLALWNVAAGSVQY